MIIGFTFTAKTGLQAVSESLPTRETTTKLPPFTSPVPPASSQTLHETTSLEEAKTASGIQAAAESFESAAGSYTNVSPPENGKSLTSGKAISKMGDIPAENGSSNKGNIKMGTT